MPETSKNNNNVDSWKKSQSANVKVPPRSNFLFAANYIRKLFDGKNINWAATGGLAILCLGARRYMLDLHIVYDDRDFQRIRAKLEADPRMKFPTGASSLFPTKVLVTTGPNFKDAGCLENVDIELNLVPAGHSGAPSREVLKKNQVLLHLNLDGKMIHFRSLNMLYLFKTMLACCRNKDLAWNAKADILFLCQSYGKQLDAIRPHLSLKELHDSFFSTSFFASLPAKEQRRCSIILLNKEVVRPQPITTAKPAMPTMPSPAPRKSPPPAPAQAHRNPKSSTAYGFLTPSQRPNSMDVSGLSHLFANQLSKDGAVNVSKPRVVHNRTPSAMAATTAVSSATVYNRKPVPVSSTALSGHGVGPTYGRAGPVGSAVRTGQGIVPTNGRVGPMSFAVPEALKAGPIGIPHEQQNRRHPGVPQPQRRHVSGPSTSHLPSQLRMSPPEGSFRLPEQEEHYTPVAAGTARLRLFEPERPGLDLQKQGPGSILDATDPLFLNIPTSLPTPPPSRSGHPEQSKPAPIAPRHSGSRSVSVHQTFTSNPTSSGPPISNRGTSYIPYNANTQAPAVPSALQIQRPSNLRRHSEFISSPQSPTRMSKAPTQPQTISTLAHAQNSLHFYPQEPPKFEAMPDFGATQGYKAYSLNITASAPAPLQLQQPTQPIKVITPAPVELEAPQSKPASSRPQRPTVKLNTHFASNPATLISNTLLPSRTQTSQYNQDHNLDSPLHVTEALRDLYDIDDRTPITPLSATPSHSNNPPQTPTTQTFKTFISGYESFAHGPYSALDSASPGVKSVNSVLDSYRAVFWSAGARSHSISTPTPVSGLSERNFYAGNDGTVDGESVFVPEPLVVRKKSWGVGL